MPNQTPEQIARDNIDRQLSDCGWIIQNKKQINLTAGLGVAVREYQTDIGPADYVLFVAGRIRALPTSIIYPTRMYWPMTSSKTSKRE